MNYVCARLYQATSVPLISAKQAAKLLTQGARSYLMLVRDDGVDSVDPWVLDAATAGTVKATDTSAPTDLVPQSEIEALRTEFSDVFAELNEPPPERPGIGHTIPLVDGAQPPAKHMYHLT